MGLGVRYCLLLTCIAALFVTGTLIFTSGFLLSRAVANETSSCFVEFTLQPERQGEEGCWMHKRFNKAVIIVIDALRYDFMVYNSSLLQDKAEYFQNKLPFLDELLRQKPMNSRLYKFLADPPTTTLQRLKGLTTGSLPTFVDAGSNFASYEITEDNFIDQLKRLKKRITFIGDDTWDGLFPGRFHRSFFYPSFNVMDLHTVDNGVLDQLTPEMKRKDWDVIIAHFLGVDHCGHRFGPSHIQMSEKLHQMDQMLRSVVKEMSDDTVLMVMGDHGMTKTGDHGGDSDQELESGLFVYSHSKITSTELPQDPAQYRTVFQVDLVPTISLLMGSPIPFSNLGMVITDLFNHCAWWKTENSKLKQTYHSLKALRLNAYQVNRYLEAYTKISSDMNVERLDQLQQLFTHAESDLQHVLTALVQNNDERDLERNMEILEDHYLTYLTEVKSMCQEMWAKFDMPSIYLGLTIIFITVCSTFLLILLNKPGQESISRLSYAFVSGCVIFSVFASLQNLYLTVMPNIPTPILFGSFDVLVFVFVTIATWKMSKKKEQTESKEIKMADRLRRLPRLDTIVIILLCCISFSGFFSNSYVVLEDSISTFCAQTVIIVLGYYVVKHFAQADCLAEINEREKSGRHKRQGRFDLMKVLTHPCSVTIVLVIVSLSLVRSSSIFRACREEQAPCESSVFFTPLPDSNFKNARYFFSVACLAGYVVACRFWLRHFGNLNGQSLSVLCVRFPVPTAAAVIGLHWALQGLPPKILDALPIWQRTVLPQTVFVILTLCIVSVLFSPLLVFILPRESDEELSLDPALATSQKILSLVNHIKLHWQKSSSSENSGPKPPVVYGLGSVYSSSVVYLVTVCSLLLSLLLGDGISPVVMVMLSVQFLYLELCAVYYSSKEKDDLAKLYLPVIGWGVISTVFFYNSGHQATITTIHWKAAFVGFQGDHGNNLIPAVLIGLNTFGSSILFTVASPLLLFCQKLRSQIFTFFSRGKSDGPQSGEKADFGFHEEPLLLRSEMFRLCLIIFFFQGLKLFGSMCAAALHRRHLMVWKIFAPRFVFEGVTSFIVLSVCLVMYLFVLRLDSVLEKWVTDLTESSKPKSA